MPSGIGRCGVHRGWDSLPPPTGVAIWGRRSCSGHVATPRVAQYPATHSCNPCRGGGNVRLLASSLPMVALAAVALLTQRLG
ncbi:MAG: hypothetical protein SPE65_08450 [Muribaculaceae bacterium]|nr:hypothetical protein [Muribaculaceae bacterium]